MFKTCSKCHIHQSTDDYHKQKNGKYGCHSQCKKCRKNTRSKISLNRPNLQIGNDMLLCCSNCGELKQNNDFYKNKLSKTGYQIYCKQCHKLKIIHSMSKLENFMKLLFKRYHKKYGKKQTILFTAQDLLDIYHDQNGKCYITNHQLDTVVDEKQRVDNIWNVSIMTFSNNKIIQKTDVYLVCNLIYSSKKQYNLSEDELRLIYRKIIM